MPVAALEGNETYSRIDRCSCVPISIVMKTSPCLALLGALLLAQPFLVAATEERVDRRFTAPPASRLVVDVDFGGIEVTTNATSEVTVEVLRKVTASSEKKEKEFLAERPLTLKQEGVTVSVQARKPGRVSSSWGWNRIKSSGLYRITVPVDCQVTLKTAGGHIHVTGVQTEVQATTSGGGLRFTEIRGAIHGRTAGGTIAVSDCVGGTEVDTSGGTIQVRGGSGSLQAATAGGSIRVLQYGGPVEVETSGGSITLENIDGKITGSTSGGSVSAILLGPPLPGEVDLATSGGSVSVTVPANLAFSLDAETSAGGVRSELPVEFTGKPKRDRLVGPVNGGGPTVRLRTSGGSISVRKANATLR